MRLRQDFSRRGADARAPNTPRMYFYQAEGAECEPLAVSAPILQCKEKNFSCGTWPSFDLPADKGRLKAAVHSPQANYYRSG